MDAEVWLPVPGWEGVYEVSSHGRVRSLDRTFVLPHPTGRRIARRFRGRVLAATGGRKNGYPLVVLTAAGGKPKCFHVHRLVMLTFVGEPAPGLEVCHNNGIRTDNRLCNLRYDTRSANSHDRRAHDTVRSLRGEAHPQARLTAAKIRWAADAISHISMRKAAKRLGVSHTALGQALRGQTWKDVFK